MAIRILRSTDPIVIKQVKLLIYGQPGSGKTTLGNSAEEPLLLDFDKGLARAKNRRDTLEIDTWQDIQDLIGTPEGVKYLREYKTLILDTVGRALDCLAAVIVTQNASYRNRAGGLSLQGYGALKQEFATFISRLSALGLDIVMVAHLKEEKQGDVTIFRPEITGGSFSEVMKISDMVGFTYMEQGMTAKDPSRHFVNFNPTANSIGKNSAGFPPLEIPHWAEDQKFLGNLIESAKRKMEEMSDSQKEVLDTIVTYRDNFAKATDEKAFVALFESYLEESPAVKAQVKNSITEAGKRLKLAYNASLKQWIPESIESGDGPPAAKKGGTAQ